MEVCICSGNPLMRSCNGEPRSRSMRILRIEGCTHWRHRVVRGRHGMKARRIGVIVLRIEICGHRRSLIG